MTTSTRKKQTRSRLTASIIAVTIAGTALLGGFLPAQADQADTNTATASEIGVSSVSNGYNINNDTNETLTLVSVKQENNNGWGHSQPPTTILPKTNAYFEITWWWMYGDKTKITYKTSGQTGVVEYVELYADQLRNFNGVDIKDRSSCINYPAGFTCGIFKAGVAGAQTVFTLSPRW